jgi:anti-sigma B factor antagonist
MTSQLEGGAGAISAELLQWSVVRSPAEIVVFLRGEVDLSTAKVLDDVLATIVADRPPIVALDVADVSFLDSSGINCLLIAARAAAETGQCKVVVRRPTRAIERVLGICGVAELFADGFDGDTDGDR